MLKIAGHSGWAAMSAILAADCIIIRAASIFSSSQLTACRSFLAFHFWIVANVGVVLKSIVIHFLLLFNDGHFNHAGNGFKRKGSLGSVVVASS